MKNLQRYSVRLITFVAAYAASTHTACGQVIAQVLPIAQDEGVYAYARISPDGRLLAYASDTKDPAHPTTNVRSIKVVELRSRRVLFVEPGIDAYWSSDGSRMIYLSLLSTHPVVSIRNQRTGEITRDVAPANLGDYFSWGTRAGREMVMTIESNYFALAGDRAELPVKRVVSCPQIGVGERPLVSHDGKRISTFVRGTIVVRDVDDCVNIVDTQLRGAKADFSWDGRYLAFHAAKPSGVGYEIRVIDLERRTVRTVTDLPGSSFFPSWTRDGRLCFRYDGDDFRGFVVASDVLKAKSHPLPTESGHVPASLAWHDIFPESSRPAGSVTVAIVWSPWSAHSAVALDAAQRLQRRFMGARRSIQVTTALEPGSRLADAMLVRRRLALALPSIQISPSRLALTGAANQIPVTLLFAGDSLIGRHLGAQTEEELTQWIFELAPSARIGLSSRSFR